MKLSYAIKIESIKTTEKDFIPRISKLCPKSVLRHSGIERNIANDVRILARLKKVFESDNKYLTAIKLCYLTNKGLNDTIAL